MDWFSLLKRYYPKFYGPEEVRIFVETGKISEEQYQEITGNPY